MAVDLTTTIVVEATPAQDSAALARRLAYAALAIVLVASTVFETVKHGSWEPAVIGILAPDVALLFGGGRDLAHGQLHRRAVPVYNAVHRFWGPFALMTAASFAVLPLGGFVLGLAWATHVAVDRAVGYGLRDRHGFQRTR